MTKIFTLACFIFSCSSALTQPYFTGKKTEIYVDAFRSRQVPADIYYPADAAGNNVSLAAGTAKFPVVVFGHGFVISPSSYEWLGDSLSRNGYIVVMPSTESSLSPSHSNFGADLAFLCNYVISLNDSFASFLYQRVIKKSAVGGHSMGGGCSYLAATGNPAINAIFNFSAAETNPSAISSASSVFAPALVFSGSSDCIVPGNTQQTMYANIPATCKSYIDITNALHCQFADNNGTCVLGQVLSGCNSSSLTPALVFSKVSALLIPFLDYYLKNDCTRGEDFVTSYINLTGVSKMQSCSDNLSCSILPITINNFSGIADDDIVILKWNITSASGFKNFTVERSINGISFSVLTDVKPKNDAPSAFYSISDKYPYPGNSFYRLKMVNTDGSFTYSTILNISTKMRLLALTKLFPNPASDAIRIELVSARKQLLHILITSATGLQVFNRYVTVDKGLNEKVISPATWGSGYYIIQCRDEQNNIIATRGIVKQ